MHFKFLLPSRAINLSDPKNPGKISSIFKDNIESWNCLWKQYWNTTNKIEKKQSRPFLFKKINERFTDQLRYELIKKFGAYTRQSEICLQVRTFFHLVRKSHIESTKLFILRAHRNITLKDSELKYCFLIFRKMI